ncbi:MFS transporter [Skermania sp. ID1734]|uniref:MFS transporter n=1 Tax=Skermania sp. ID1734 TaxID=2597516 RepID=UPI00117DEA88|nr:MFS transporter [Skermania sp. ID1734]TSD93934.1 MFS transporter [Skermania sp. ID1734]
MRRARISVFAIFGLNGFLLAMWVVHIPAITSRTGVSSATLGALILVLALGSIAGMQLAGPLADRFGSQLLVTVAAALVSLSVVGPGLAINAWQLAIALALFGFANGALDVSMNSQAVQVERGYRRPIMAAFHALFSCGGIVGSLAGAATMRAGWDVRVTLSMATAIGLAVTAACAFGLLPHVAVARSASAPVGSKVLALGAIAFALLLAEGVANDWSALQVKDDLGVADSTAALAFGAFSLTMTVGRFTADRVSGAIGPVAVVRIGALIAGFGMVTVIGSNWIGVTLLGWALFGLGLSGCIPQLFTAAGNVDAAAAGAVMSRVFGLGYIGFLAGPAIIGGLSAVIPLTAAMCVPLGAVLLASACARVVTPVERAVVQAPAAESA